MGLVGSVGPDFPPGADAWLKKSGIDCQGIRRGALPSVRAWQVLEASGLRTQVWRVESSVRREYLSRSMAALPDDYRQAKGFHFGVHPLSPDTRFIEELGKMDGVISIESYCAADHKPDDESLKKLLQAADIFSLNEHEAVSLVGPGKPLVLAGRLVAGGAKILCLRLGENGSLVVDAKNGNAFQVPAVPVSVVDTVGAGNAYCGGFLAGWVETRDLKMAGLYGAAASSFLLEQVGLPVFGSEILKETQERVDMLRPQVVAVTI
ncbi:MAG: carbohydrate kinase family protein [Anaerolineaceae bacterium]|nr:carbohydrate kinase family protein [Anaerolineaceae bacterium]